MTTATRGSANLDSVRSAVRMRGIDKAFGPVRANRHASLDVAVGEIHALVGENGAGKSTLMRILGGLLAPDAGIIEVNGVDVTGWSAADAIRAGIGIVHQHFMLVPTLSVAENIVLGAEPTRHGMLDRAQAVADVQRLSEETGLAIDGTRLVADLSVGEAQRVEILKTLYRGAKILVLDEPTAVLSPPEVKELVHVLQRVREGGGTIVIITHRLDEVMTLSDRITVMRDGQTVAHLRTADTNPAELAHAMVGRQVQLTHREEPSAPTTTPPAELLAVRDLVVAGNGQARHTTREVDCVSFTVHAGEIFGIAGVEGNGQRALIETIAGLRKAEGGSIHVSGTDLTYASVTERHDAGLSHIPDDRQQRGLVMEYTVADNLVLGLHRHFCHHGLIDRSAVDAHARQHIETFDIRPPHPALPARALSGGNQQKIVVAREMGRPYTVLLAAQPTRGVDVGAIELIHRALRDARAAGKAIVLVSAELNEVLSLADRVAVMYRGAFATVLPVAQATEDLLGEYMIGAKRSAAA